jgi:hypothetical protein
MIHENEVMASRDDNNNGSDLFNGTGLIIWGESVTLRYFVRSPTLLFCNIFVYARVGQKFQYNKLISNQYIDSFSLL